MTEEGWRGRAICIEYVGKTSWRQLEPTAKACAQKVREKEGEGYDLRSFSLKCYMLRNDKPIQVKHELRPDPYSEGLIESSRRRPHKNTATQKNAEKGRVDNG